MSKKPKKTSATVVLAVVLLFSGIAVIAASFGMQEWQIRQDADEYEALMQSVKAPPQSPMEESSKPDENAADAASTDIPMQSEESPAGIPVSTFKRPEGQFAGTLIDNAGLKGLRIGGASVSTLHAGFLVNDENGTAADYLALIAAVQKAVQEDSGVWLEPEVRILGEDAPVSLL